MSDDLQSPNLVEKGKNLAKYTWQLINYIQNNYEKALVVDEEEYKERIKGERGVWGEFDISSVIGKNK